MNLDVLLYELRPILPFPLIVKAAVLAAVALALVVGYYFFMWSPLQENIEMEKAQVERQRILLKKNQRLAKDIPKKKEEYKQLQTQLKIALNMLPKKSQIPDLLEDVTWSGKDSGLAFSAFRPRKEIVKSIYAEVPVDLEITGTFKQLLTFLKRVGELSRIVDVKGLQMVVDEGQQLKIKGQVVTYRFIEKVSKKRKKGRKR
jgi:type IV pilus assembly protein PilO